MRDEARMVLETARAALGTPYILGGESLTQGIDCSGLVKNCLQAGICGFPMEDVSAQGLYTYLAKQVGEVAAPLLAVPYLPGTILFFGISKQAITHTALAFGPRHHIEAAGQGPSAQVRIRPQGFRKDLIARVNIWNDETWG